MKRALIVALLFTGCSMNKKTDLPDFSKLWDFSDPAGTEKKFRDLLSTAESSGDVGYHAELLTQIARTQGLQRNFDDAHATLDGVEKMLTPELKKARVRYLLERGRAFNSSRQADKAKPLFMEAWDVAREAGIDGLAVDAAHMVAIAVSSDPDQSLKWNLIALDYAEKSSDESAQKWLGSLYNNIGWTWFDKKEYDKALDLFEKALAWREEKGALKPVLIAKWCVAKALRMLGRVEEALKMQQIQLAEYEEHKLDHSGYTHEEVGECLLALKKGGHEPYFAKAWEILSRDSWLVANEADRIERLKDLGTPK